MNMTAIQVFETRYFMALATTSSGLTWLTRFIGFGLLAVLGYLLFRIVITATNPESIWTQPAMGEASSGSAKSSNTQSFSFNTDPFNSDVDVPVTIVAIGEDAPETTLNLKLTGRTVGPSGSAILRTPDNEEASYRIGDEIVPGVTLQAVNKDFIVLSVDGQLQRLTFEREKETSFARKAETRPRTPTAVARSATAKSNINSLFQDIGLKRVMKNGQLAGYSVRPNKAGFDVGRYGFQKSDIVTSIGGTDLTRGRPDFVALLSSAVENGGADITVLRDGKNTVIRLGAQ